jgi:glycosyltransferase involved in cell wall biosynthesis
MRIAIDTRDLRIARTGNRTYLEEICRALTEVEGEHVIVPLIPRWHPPTGRSTLHKIVGHLSFYWWKEFGLPFRAWQERCDVLFCTDYVVPLFASCPTVPVFHGANFWERPGDYNKWWHLLLSRLALPAARRAGAIVTVSDVSRQRLIKFANLPAEKMRVIYEGPKRKAIRPITTQEIEQQLAAYGLVNTPFILSVGVMEKRKNLPRLIEAFARAFPHIDSAYRLVLVGQPGPMPSLDDSGNVHSVIENLDLSEKVVLTGYVPDEALAAFYQAATFYAFPSLYEGFGLPLLEAFANNLPVTAAQATSIPEVAGNAVLFFDPLDVDTIAEALIKLGTDPDLRESFVVKGHNRLAEFSWEKTARQLLGLFVEVIERERGHAD